MDVRPFELFLDMCISESVEHGVRGGDGICLGSIEREAISLGATQHTFASSFPPSRKPNDSVKI